MAPRPLNDHVRRRMQTQRRRDTGLELRLRKSLHAQGLRYRVDFRLEPTLRCRGDVVFTRQKVVVFVDGCFWHGCPLHFIPPANNAGWWRDKIAGNIARDKRNSEALVALGWTVIRLWEHETTSRAIEAVRDALSGESRKREASASEDE